MTNPRFLTALGLVALILTGCSQKSRPFSVQIVQSEISTHEDASYLDFREGKLKWDYTVGLELEAFLNVYDRYGDQHIFDYVENWYDRMIDSTGAIVSYSKEKFNIDHVCPGRDLFYLYDKTGKEKYRLAIERLRDQLKDQPRTSQGGFWHKQRYPYQMWLDGLYMGQPFYAEYASRYEDEAQRNASFEDICKHFLIVAEHTFDPETKLYRHAWDESREMFWCNPETGQSEHAWGRALGWYCMAIVETMEFIPEGTPGRAEVLDIFRGIFDVLPSFADPETGMWYQVLDQPGREGNYVEATCNAMFVFSMLKGIRLGYLPAELDSFARSAYDSLLKTFVTTDNAGIVTLHRCCAVAGLGGDGNRSGTFDYYIGETIRDNDAKGIGPLIWAALEIER